MALFDKSSIPHGDLDWEIIQNGWTSLYFNLELYQQELAWFRNEKFQVVELDASQWKDKETVHKELKSKLNFPGYYGGNLSALNDCLWDLEIRGAGLIIAFSSFEVVEKEFAHQLLDIFASNSRQYSLFGYKLITLVQVNEPDYDCPPVGASPVLWNNKEWLNKSRGL